MTQDDVDDRSKVAPRPRALGNLCRWTGKKFRITI
jgi:hypothetical protein